MKKDFGYSIYQTEACARRYMGENKKEIADLYWKHGAKWIEHLDETNEWINFWEWVKCLTVPSGH